MADPRTKQTAMETLEAMRLEVVQNLEDDEVAKLLSPELLKLVFAEAWRLQSEEDTSYFMRAARDLVVEAVNQANSGEVP